MRRKVFQMQFLEKTMDMTTILLIVVVILLFGGGGFYGWSRRR
jgi:LPXTG-motif cell wall-anchored protein